MTDTTTNTLGSMLASWKYSRTHREPNATTQAALEAAERGEVTQVENFDAMLEELADTVGDAVDALREIVEEVVYLFDEAREAGHSAISSMVGSRFEAEARAALCLAEARYAATTLSDREKVAPVTGSWTVGSSLHRRDRRGRNIVVLCLD